MFGKWVTIDLGEDVRCDVFVLCTPATPDDILQTRAFAQLASHLTQRAGVVAKTSAERVLQSANEVAKMFGVDKSPRA